MITLTYSLLVLAVASLSEGRTFQFQNKHEETIWVGSLGNPGHQSINGGGWEMAAGTTMTVNVDDSWQGRIWGRTGCKFDASGRGSCQTGDCGGVLKCNGAGGKPPSSLLEVTLRGSGGNDYYDVSLVDGYNIPITMTPTDASGGGDHYRCRPATCTANVNAKCPSELQVVANGAVVACKSACLAFNTDQYCCRGAYNTPQTCKSSTWPKNYPSFFKGLCPDAYSYAYDDKSSTFTCANTGYRITFG
ncbi:pathogenesis-related thaumatin-like protein 3.5 [Schistocerca piceifrons]|uniref:pathogenesis-related thaumatin-like protein 3.5 n=1 Tax=Schistocerca piceifrons TaxID=274613 RepID=UPI001F5F5D31|nr:pathogenesis-related thaumatin-like protein 3.5 [Schistocerca piceifrons]